MRAPRPGPVGVAVLRNGLRTGPGIADAAGGSGPAVCSHVEVRCGHPMHSRQEEGRRSLRCGQVAVRRYLHEDGAVFTRHRCSGIDSRQTQGNTVHAGIVVRVARQCSQGAGELQRVSQERFLVHRNGAQGERTLRTAAQLGRRREPVGGGGEERPESAAV